MLVRDVICVWNLGSLLSHVLHTAQKLDISTLQLTWTVRSAEKGHSRAAGEQVTSANVRTTWFSYLSISRLPNR